MRVAGGATTPVVVDVDDLRELLGRERFHAEEIAERTAVPGVATGLAVTGAGGDVLFVEATSMDGEPSLQVTGQLGDVMKESAEIALSWVRATATTSTSTPMRWPSGSTCTSPPGPCPRTGRRPGSP